MAATKLHEVTLGVNNLPTQTRKKKIKQYIKKQLNLENGNQTEVL